MSIKIGVAYRVPDGPLRATRRPAVELRRNLAELWVSQALQNILIIGISRAEAGRIAKTVTDRWCQGLTAQDVMEP